MGSALFEVTVASRDSTSGQVKLTIKSIHPDSGEPEGEIFFAMQLLHEFLGLVMQPVRRMSFSMTAEDRQKLREQHPVPSEQDAPALNDEVSSTGCLDESWLVKNTTSYIKDCTWDKVSKTLTITPTHPAWTTQCKDGDSVETAAYILGDSVPADAAAPLKPIDRSVPIEAVEDPLAGFEMKKPKKFREDNLRRQRENDEQNTSSSTEKPSNLAGGFTMNQSRFGNVSGFGQQQQQQQSSTTSSSSSTTATGWAQPKASEAKKDDGWGGTGFGSTSSTSSSSNGGGFSGFGFGSFGGSSTTAASGSTGGGFGSGFGSAFGSGFGNNNTTSTAAPVKPAAATCGFESPMDEVPDRDIPLPLHSAVKYSPVTPLPEIADLIPLPVLYTSAFGGSTTEIGTIVATKTEDVGNEKVTYCVIYSEGDCIQSCAQVTLDKVLGRAALMKPRKRVE